MAEILEGPLPVSMYVSRCDCVRYCSFIGCSHPDCKPYVRSSYIYVIGYQSANDELERVAERYTNK